MEVVGGDLVAAPSLPPQVPQGCRNARQRDLGVGRRGGIDERQQRRLLVETGVVGDELAGEDAPKRVA
jgi:hypothetical protein